MYVINNNSLDIKVLKGRAKLKNYQMIKKDTYIVFFFSN